MVIEYATNEQPIGIEITAPTRLTLEQFNNLLRELGQPTVTQQDLAPLLAAQRPGHSLKQPTATRRAPHPRPLAGRLAVGYRSGPLLRRPVFSLPFNTGTARRTLVAGGRCFAHRPCGVMRPRT
jgi:hypothetical protein